MVSIYKDKELIETVATVREGLKRIFKLRVENPQHTYTITKGNISSI